MNNSVKDAQEYDLASTANTSSTSSNREDMSPLSANHGIAWTDEAFYCRWLAKADDVARYLHWAGDRSAWTSDGRQMITPIDDVHGAPLRGEHLQQYRAMQKLLDEMEDEGLLVSKIFPDGLLRRSLTDKGEVWRANLRPKSASTAG